MIAGEIIDKGADCVLARKANQANLHADVAWLREQHKWPGLRAIIMVESSLEIAGNAEREMRLYITFPALAAEHVALNLIRKAPGKDSLRLRRKVAAWDDDFLASLLASLLAACALPPPFRCRPPRLPTFRIQPDTNASISLP